MRTTFLPVVFAVLSLCLPVYAGEKKSEIKWDMDYLDQTWGIKLKSAKFDEQKQEVKMLLEFTKNVTELQPMREAFQTTGDKAELWFLFFDEDNVAFAKGKLKSVEGELSGKAGEAFRIVLPAPENNPKAFSITKKVTARQSEGKAPSRHFTNSIGMKFVWIPPGNFLMGSPKEERLRSDNETQHKVTLTKGFYMGVYTVTQEQWQAVMGKNPSFFKGEKNLPVDSVSWDDCQEFIKKLREKDKDKKAYRLPTEAEWEYACRAGTTTPFHFGETISTDQANCNGENPYGNGKKGVYRKKTTPVGSFPANAWGLHDMHGNLWQWCQDWYAAEYPKNDVTDPQGPENGELRVLRGGSWYLHPESCRSARRVRSEPGGFRYDVYGCRLCFCLD